MRDLKPVDHRDIIVGKPLPFAVYGADRTLLLAAGRLVPNEFVREGLLRGGRYCSEENAVRPTGHAAAEPQERVSLHLESLQRDYRRTSVRAQVGFRMEREAHGTTYTSHAMGATETGALLMSSPVAADGTRVTLIEGDTWTFRALYAVAALRFNATVAKAGIGSDAYFYAVDIRNVERRDVRKWPRVPTCKLASREGEVPRLIVDLSVGGARIATDNHSTLQRSQEILLSPTLKVLDEEQTLAIEATVLNVYGHADAKHPNVQFYGVQFEKMAELQRLLIHAYVQENLCLELDRVSHVLSLPLG